MVITSDPRVLAAVEHIARNVGEPIALQAHLSPSRFRHLCVQKTGMPLRNCLLWRRRLHVWTLLVQGRSELHHGRDVEVEAIAVTTNLVM